MRGLDHIREAAAFLDTRAPPPQVVLMLGSGLASLADRLEDSEQIAYRDIPHFPAWPDDDGTAALACGRLWGRQVVLMTRRFQYLNGCSADDIGFPLRTLKTWGADTVILTNAAGGIDPTYGVGDLVAITDHIDFTHRNVLIGPNIDALGPRFPDMSEIYSRRLLDLCLRTANELGIGLRTGVYLGVTGPSYETPAEIRVFRTIGADLVGMSTVSEAIVARHMDMQVLGLSTVTNQAAGNTPLRLAHEDVLAVGARKAQQLGALLEGLFGRL